MQSQPINHKNCPTCGSNSIIKHGKQTGLQRYKCKDCDFRFQSSRRQAQSVNNLAHKYLFKNNP
jgi:transposase-like protein